MNLIEYKLHEIEQHGYELDFSNVMNHAVENYKKIALYAGLVLFVSISLLFLLAIIFLPVKNPDKIMALLNNMSYSQILTFNGLNLIITCIISPFQAAFLKMADCSEKDEEFHISTLFSYYRPPYFKEIIGATFLVSLINFLQTALLFYFGLTLLSSLITYFISFITLLMVPLIIFGELNSIKAIKYSIIIVLKKPLLFIGLLLTTLLIMVSGFVFCVIGFFFTVPFLYSMKYTIYEIIIGAGSQNETAQVN